MGRTASLFTRRRAGQASAQQGFDARIDLLMDVLDAAHLTIPCAVDALPAAARGNTARVLAALAQIGVVHEFEALDVLRSWRPDVITLDVMMPEQSGLTFYGAVCRNEDWKRIPVVMLSAVPISVREHAFATIGLTQGPLPAPAACLEKPCTPEALLEVVNRLVPEPTTA